MQYVIALAVLLIAGPALAQSTPSQTALQIDSVIGLWAQQLESQAKEITDLQKQIADLKAKYEAPKK